MSRAIGVLSPSLERKGLDGWIHAGEMSRAAYGTAAAWSRVMRAAGWDITGFLAPGAAFQAGWAYSRPPETLGDRGVELNRGGVGQDDVEAEGGLLEITCRGTSQLWDVLLDLTAWVPVRWSELPRGWWVGHGMARGPRRAWPEILDLFARFRPKRVHWSGHSAGGSQATLCDAAARLLGMDSSCVAVEPARVLRPPARDAYRLLLADGQSPSVVVINAHGGHLDAVTQFPRSLRHGPDLAILGQHRVFEGEDAREEWHNLRSGSRRWWRPSGKRHGIEPVIEHMVALRAMTG